MVIPHTSNDFWSDVIIAAAGDNETFDDVNIRTLRSQFTDMVAEQAHDILLLADLPPTDDNIRGVMVSLVTTDPPIRLCETVSIGPKGITITMDIPEITDESIFQAMRMLSTAVDGLDGCYGFTKIGVGRDMGLSDLVSFEQSPVNCLSAT